MGTNNSHTRRRDPARNVTEQQINTAIQAAVGAANGNPKNDERNSNAKCPNRQLNSSDTINANPRYPCGCRLKTQASSEVAASSTEKPQSSPSPTNTTQAAAEAKELNADTENCSAPLTQPTSLGNASQKCFTRAPPLQVPADSSNAFGKRLRYQRKHLRCHKIAQCRCDLASSPNEQHSQLARAVVFEFSPLGLGAPTLLVGVLYLLLRRV